MKKLVLGLILVLLLLLIAACNKKEETAVQPEQQVEEPAEEPAEEPEKDEEPKEIVYKNQYPLTGIRTDDDIEYRAFGVMIENSLSARPQSGLYQADVVYEVLAEASITRLLAFYHSEKPEIIGPVRSARDYNIHLNNGYKAIYVSAGGSPGAFAVIQSGQVDYINGLSYDGRYLWRSKERKAPHNMYTNYENLIDAAEHAKHSLIAPVPALPFLEKDVNLEGKEKAVEISIIYGSSTNNVVYKYEQDNDQYIRIVGGEQNLDLETNNPVVIDNIFIVEMSHQVIDKQGRRAINTTSGGEGLLIQNGVYQRLQWKSVDGQILPIHDGKIVGFVKGKTWINVVPSLDGNISIME
ncbi:DUF3048 domain-containing protein [Bacillaceae bacterium IKA-2]|jgi:hypothetical protein|nr:DUF3048 domain-containing protein [Bacillaceae bacterium IKA-2]